ncbi:MAG: carboxypeptidase regulatory-like domain-containing protein [Cyanobacteria bacterium P01_D01_bin.105]
MKQPLRNTLLMLAAVGMAVIPTKAFAHQVQTNYILKNTPFANEVQGSDQTLELQTTFSNGQPLKGAKVKVYAPEQSLRPYKTGVTDGQGRYSFNPNESIEGEWEVQIRREGHGDILYVPVNEDGIDAQLLASEPDIIDTHYASSPLMAVGSIAIAAASLAFARVSRQRKA